MPPAGQAQQPQGTVQKCLLPVHRAHNSCQTRPLKASARTVVSTGVKQAHTQRRTDSFRPVLLRPTREARTDSAPGRQGPTNSTPLHCSGTPCAHYRAQAPLEPSLGSMIHVDAARHTLQAACAKQCHNSSNNAARHCMECAPGQSHLSRPKHTLHTSQAHCSQQLSAPRHAQCTTMQIPQTPLAAKPHPAQATTAHPAQPVL